MFISTTPILCRIEISHRYASFLRLVLETIILRQYGRNLVFVVLDIELEKIIDDTRVYMHRTIKRLELSRETARKLYGYIKNTATTVNISLQTKKTESTHKKIEGIVRN